METIAIRDGEYFKYNGQWSFEFPNIRNVNIQVGMQEEPFLASRNIKETKVRGRKQPYFIEVEEAPLELTLQFGWDDPMDTDEIREVARWLHQDYYVEFFTSSTPTRIFYVIPANGDINYIHNCLDTGYISLTLRNISPYSYSPIYVKNYSELDFSTISSEIEESANYGATIDAIWGDDTYIYIGGRTTRTVRKLLKTDLSLVAESGNFGEDIAALWGDDTHIYVGGGNTSTSTGTVKKLLKTDLSLVTESGNYGGKVFTIKGDDTHIYIGGTVTQTVKKLLKTDLSLVTESGNYGGIIWFLWDDNTHVYVGGDTTQTVKKLLKTDLSLVTESGNYGGTINILWGDDTHIFIGGTTTQTVKKLLKTDLSLVTESGNYGGAIYSLWGDNTHIYAGGWTTQKIRKLLKSDLSQVLNFSNYGGTIWTLWDDDTHIFAGGVTTQTVRKYIKLGLGSFTIINSGDLSCNPEIWINKVTEGGTVTITNNSNGGKVFGFDNLVTDEIVYTDNEDLYIETDEAATYRYDDRITSFEPIELIRGNNNFVILGNCKLQMRYQFKTLQG